MNHTFTLIYDGLIYGKDIATLDGSFKHLEREGGDVLEGLPDDQTDEPVRLSDEKVLDSLGLNS